MKPKVEAWRFYKNKSWKCWRDVTTVLQRDSLNMISDSFGCVYFPYLFQVEVRLQQHPGGAHQALQSQVVLVLHQTAPRDPEGLQDRLQDQTAEPEQAKLRHRATRAGERVWMFCCYKQQHGVQSTCRSESGLLPSSFHIQWIWLGGLVQGSL